MLPEYTISLEGDKAMIQALNDIGQEMDNLLKEMMEKMGDALVKNIRAEAPRSPRFRTPETRSARLYKNRGPLYQSIVRSTVEKVGDGYKVVVYEDDKTLTNWNGVHYGTFVRSGTRGHKIVAKNSTGLLFFHVVGAVLSERKGREAGPRGYLVVRNRSKTGRRYNFVSGQLKTNISRPNRTSGKLARTPGYNTLMFAPEVTHPGTKSDDFVARGIAASQDEILKIQKQAVRKIERRWAQIGSSSNG